MQAPPKLKIELPYKSAIPLLDTNPKKSETLIQNVVCTPMFTAACLTVGAAVWTQSKRPSADKQIMKMRYPDTTEHDPATKRTGIFPFATTRMDLEGVMLHEVSQTAKDKHRMISLTSEI